MHTNLLAATLQSLSIGPAVIVDNLAMLPLFPLEPFANRASTIEHRTSNIDYAVLDDALASGDAEVTEVSDEGVVPELRVINRGNRSLLIVDGEELVGAKQNRVVNLTVLVAANSQLTIPVSCVEAGRWRARSRVFTSASRAQYTSGRVKRMSHVTQSMAMTGDRRSNQADVWDDIAEKSQRLRASSPTAAMAEMFTVHEHSVDAFVEGLRPLDGQVGVIFAIDDRIVGFDLFDRPATLRAMLPKLVRSAAIDAIDSACTHRAAGRIPRGSADLATQASRFLATTAKLEPDVHPAVGLGEDARLSAPRLTGAALVVDNQVVHFGAFAI